MIVEIKDSSGNVIDWYEENKPTDGERIVALEEQLNAYDAAYQEGVNEA